MDIGEMRGYLSVTRKKFSEMYGIPLRTLEDWEAGKRKPAEYIINLLERAVKEDKKMVCADVLERAKKLNEYEDIPEVEVGEECKLIDIWDGEGEQPDDSYSYLLTNNGEDGESNLDIYINYCFKIVEQKDDPVETIIKITDINLI